MKIPRETDRSKVGFPVWNGSLPRRVQPKARLWGVPSRPLYSLVNVYSLLLKIAIEIVDLPIKNGDFAIVM
jgi:hypothetical protein